MLFEVISLLIVAFLSEVIVAWPDGSPCIHSAFESMNPLEAVEHQGGLRVCVQKRLTTPSLQNVFK